MWRHLQLSGVFCCITLYDKVSPYYNTLIVFMTTVIPLRHIFVRCWLWLPAQITMSHRPWKASVRQSMCRQFAGGKPLTCQIWRKIDGTCGLRHRSSCGKTLEVSRYFAGSHRSFRMMTSWYEKAFRITGPLWWESTGDRWIHHKGPEM